MNDLSAKLSVHDYQKAQVEALEAKCRDLSSELERQHDKMFAPRDDLTAAQARIRQLEDDRLTEMRLTARMGERVHIAERERDEARAELATIKQSLTVRVAQLEASMTHLIDAGKADAVEVNAAIREREKRARIAELETERDEARAEVQRLNEQCVALQNSAQQRDALGLADPEHLAKLETALRFYADHDNWFRAFEQGKQQRPAVLRDCGDRARAALEDS